MTREDIIRMARQAGIEHLPDNWGDGWWQADSTQSLERFAELVAAEERKEVNRLRDLCQEMLKELYAYRASEYLKDVTAAIRARQE